MKLPAAILTPAALLVLSGTLPAQAATPYTPPSGCELKMTIQNRGCIVSQHYICSSDAPGDQRVSYFTNEGEVYTSRIDIETRWMESTNLVTGLTDVLEPEAKDHASFRKLLKRGEDDFDFWTRSNNGERLHHVGKDILTGETVTIDNVPLEVTEFNLTTYSQSGDVLIERSGKQYINREHGRFYGGVEHSRDWTGAAQESNDTPVTFAFPGEPGFGATKPEYDCEMQMVDGRAPGLIDRLKALSDAT